MFSHQFKLQQYYFTLQMQGESSETLQDKLHEITGNCNRQPYNVLAHRRIKNNKVKDLIGLHINKTTEITQQTPLSSSLAQSIVQEDGSNNLERDRHQTEDFTRKIKTLEEGSKYFVKDRSLIRKKDHSQNYINEKSYVSQVDWRKHKSKESSKGQSSIQKERRKFPKEMHNPRKGPLEQKHLINWLNFVISEYCLQDSTNDGTLKGLQRFALDKNALLSKGLTNQYIFRIYQTLFAHSFGLHTTVQQLCLKKGDIAKAVWKVYAFLLEYCSNGSFQTTMGELERDMISKQNKLLAEIEKREAIINRNDEIMDQKLQKYQKDNKQLRKAVEQLEQKIEQLQNQFREIQIAYNYEVRLRLNYAHKINKVYSVHQRLNILHNSLLRDFKQTDSINKKMTVQTKDAKEKNIQLKADIKQAMAQIHEQLYKIKESESTIQALKMNEQLWKDRLSKEIAIKENEKHELKEKEKRIHQLQSQGRSMNLMINMMRTSADSQFQQYRRLTTIIAELSLANNSQLQKINELVGQVNFLNKKQSKINIELNHLVIKNQYFSEQLIKKDDEIDKLKKQLQKREVELNARLTEIDSLNKTDQSLKKNMKQIKAICEKLEEQANSQRKYSTELYEQYTVTHQQKLEFEVKLKSLHQDKFALELELNRSISDIINLNKKYESENVEQIRKYEKLHNVWSGQDKIQATMAEQIAKLNQQLQKANLRISFLSRQFSDLNFEKAKIQSMYKDNLVLHDKEKRAQKDLLIQISRTREKLQDASREISINTRTHQQDRTHWQKQKQKLLNTIFQQAIQIQKKQGFVHPMLLDDALHTLQREQQAHKYSKMHFVNELQMENQKNMKIKMELQRKQTQFRNHMKENEKKIEQTRKELEREREYFKLKTEELRTLNYTLQTKISYQKQEMQKKFDSENKDDSRLLHIMKQKNSQIQELLKELEHIQDNYQRKNVQFQQEIKSIYKQNEDTISNLKQEKKQLQVQMENIEKDYQHKLVQKEKQIQEVIASLQKEKHAKQHDFQDQHNKGKSLTHTSSEMKRFQFIRKLKIVTLNNKK